MGDGEGDWEVTANGYKVSLGGEGNDLKLDDGDGCTTLQIH